MIVVSGFEAATVVATLEDVAVARLAEPSDKLGLAMSFLVISVHGRPSWKNRRPSGHQSRAGIDRFISSGFWEELDTTVVGPPSARLRARIALIIPL